MGRPEKQRGAERSASQRSTTESPTAREFSAIRLNPQTCCSNCQTIFEVSIELLGSTDTRVRCGECLSIFDALTNLREDSDGEVLVDDNGKPIDQTDTLRKANRDFPGGLRRKGDASSSPNYNRPGSLAREASSQDVTYSDFDLFSADANLSEVLYLDQMQDSQGFDFDEFPDLENDETLNDQLFARGSTVDTESNASRKRTPKENQGLQNVALDSDVDFITDEAPHEPLVFKYRERETRNANSATGAAESPYDLPPDPQVYSGVDYGGNEPVKASRPWLLRGFLVFLVLLLAGALYGYRERDVLLTNPLARALLEKSCEWFECTLPPLIDLNALKAINRSVVSHPTLPSVLIIKFGMVNEAQFSQPYPILEIRLTNRTGGLVVTNSFSPSEYLKQWQPGDVLDVGKRLDVSLSVRDPGKTAVSFELDFR